MTLVRKLQIYVTIAAAIFLVGAYYTVTDYDDDKYVLSVLWKPATLSWQNPVDIRVFVDGAQIIGRSKYQSPWTETMTTVKGAAVTLTATAHHPAVFYMDCSIMVNGNSIPRTGFRIISGPGVATCTN